MEKENSDRRNPGKDFRTMFEAFGKAMSEVFNDPELKEKAKEMGESISKSAETFANRFKDEDVKKKFGEAGEAAKEFGKSMADYFQSDKKSSDCDEQK